MQATCSVQSHCSAQYLQSNPSLFPLCSLHLPVSVVPPTLPPYLNTTKPPPTNHHRYTHTRATPLDAPLSTTSLSLLRRLLLCIFTVILLQQLSLLVTLTMPTPLPSSFASAAAGNVHDSNKRGDGSASGEWYATSLALFLWLLDFFFFYSIAFLLCNMCIGWCWGVGPCESVMHEP